MQKPSLTPRFVAQSLKVPMPIAMNPASSGDGPDTAFTSITTDSRKIQPGCLFVALPGEKFDGHDFLEAALKGGARGVLTRRDRAPKSASTWIFAVEDTVEAYRQLAHAWRMLFDIPVIAVAGSVGKTTTKEILSSVLRGKWNEVLKTQGSQNGFVGIPMTLLELKPTHGAAVIEIGIDEIGAMEKHMPLVAPTHAVLTAIGPEHLEKLIDVPTVAREEAIALSHTASHGGFVAVNLDDPWIRPQWDSLNTSKKLGFTLGGSGSSGASGPVLRAQLSADPNGGELVFDAHAQPKGVRHLLVPMPGVHNARNFLAAVAVAQGLGLTLDEIRAGLKTFKGAEGRSELRTLPGGGVAVCDYYNAQPVSMEAGFELLSSSARGKTRFACIGDMLELGTQEEALHRGLADSVIRLGIENVLLYGPRMKWLADELQRKNYSGFLAHFGSHAELAQALKTRMRTGDALLIKGSRGMKMEEVWKLIQLSPSAHQGSA